MCLANVHCIIDFEHIAYLDGNLVYYSWDKSIQKGCPRVKATGANTNGDCSSYDATEEDENVEGNSQVKEVGALDRVGEDLLFLELMAYIEIIVGQMLLFEAWELDKL